MSFDSTKRDLDTLVSLVEMLGYNITIASAKSEPGSTNQQYDTVLLLVTKVRPRETSDDGTTHVYDIPSGVRYK